MRCCMETITQDRMETQDPQQRNPHSPIRVYLVDDDPEDRGIFQEALEETEIPNNLRTFSDGMSLLREIRSGAGTPDILFLDLYMPVMDGKACLQAIRDRPEWDGIPIILYSNAYDLDTVEEVFQAGANRYLRKPDTFDSLVLSLKRTLDSVRRNSMGGTSVINVVA